MLCAIVDLGSNTMRICIYEYDGKNFRSIFEKKTMAGLANYIKNEQLTKIGIQRACDILIDYNIYLDNFQIAKTDVHVFATASLRNIVNTKEVTRYIKEVTGYDIELLSGEEEATLDFIGATQLIDNNSGILVDIGGGSTEIVSYQEREIQYAVSMPIGSLNLYVKHVKKIIPKPDERSRIQESVIEHLNSLELKKENIPIICGVGGTMRGTGKLSNHIYKRDKSNNSINVSDITEILEMINNSHKKTISPILQTIPDRIHTIIPGLIIAKTISEYFNSKQIVISRYGIREGYLYERIIKGE